MCHTHGEDIEKTYRRSFTVKNDEYILVRIDEEGWHFKKLDQ